jgi:hypothetical protein
MPLKGGLTEQPALGVGVGRGGEGVGVTVGEQFIVGVGY